MRQWMRQTLGNPLYEELKYFARTRVLRQKNASPPAHALGSLVLEDFIVCNFCGTMFEKTGPVHSEFLHCPRCGSNARDRVVYQCILHEINTRAHEQHLFIAHNHSLSNLRLLETSPKENARRRQLLAETLAEYAVSDFDMSAYRTDLKIDLTSEQDVAPFNSRFDIIINSHVLEHIPDYRMALRNLHSMLAPGGLLVLQAPLLEARYTPVTWDEFHGDHTRVYHRFAFDLLEELDAFFERVTAVVGLLDFPITSPEIKPEKYTWLQAHPERCLILGSDLVRYMGLGCPDLCDAFIAIR